MKIIALFLFFSSLAHGSLPKTQCEKYFGNWRKNIHGSFDLIHRQLRQSLSKDEHLRRILECAVEVGIFPAASLYVAERTQEVPLFSHTVGTWQDEISGISSEVTSDHLFDIASLTKSFTAAAIFKLADEKKTFLNQKGEVEEFSLATRARQVLHPLKDGYIPNVSILQLLEHRSGLTDGGGFGRIQNYPQDKLPEQILKAPHQAHRWGYTDYSDIEYLWLGLVVEQLSGLKLGEYFQSEIFKPLGLTKIKFFPVPEKLLRPLKMIREGYLNTKIIGFTKNEKQEGFQELIFHHQMQENMALPSRFSLYLEHPFSTSNYSERNRLAPLKRQLTLENGHSLFQPRGVVYDEQAQAMGGLAGNAGLFSNAEDLSRFFQGFLKNVKVLVSSPTKESERLSFQLGPSKEEGFLSSEMTMKILKQRRGKSFKYGFDRGFIQNTKNYPGFTSLKFPYTLGRSGFTGGSFMMEPCQGVSVTLLTNRSRYAHAKNIGAINLVRRAVHDVVAGATLNTIQCQFTSL